MTTPSTSLEGYAFDLRLFCGGYAYFSTYSEWEKWGEHGREFRKPRQDELLPLWADIKDLQKEPRLVKDEADFRKWLVFGGWGIVSSEIARAYMTQWLKSKQCVSSSNGTYTDVEICSPNSLKYYASQGKRTTVIEREGEECILCQKSSKDGIYLTMQHVKPFSKGGETTTRNLVAMCEECNASLTDLEYPFLYGLVDLPNGYDLGIFGGKKMSEDEFHHVRRVSNNLMHTRCEVW